MGRGLMGFTTIIYEKRGRIAHVKLNRPDRLNAVNDAMSHELITALADFDQDPEVWVAIISGNGRAFSSGADLGQRREPTDKSPRAYPPKYPLQDVQNWKPVVAAVQGYCAGWTFGYLILDCDLIVATQDAVFDLPEVKLGIPFPHLWARLYFWLGSKKATELAILGQPLSAQEAYRLGLVSRVVANQEELLAAAESMAERIAELPPMGIRATIQISRRASINWNHEGELLFGALRFQEWEDYREAMRAFVERRKPIFQGK